MEYRKSAEPGAIKDLVIMETDAVFLSFSSLPFKKRKESPGRCGSVGCSVVL